MSTRSNDLFVLEGASAVTGDHVGEARHDGGSEVPRFERRRTEFGTARARSLRERTIPKQKGDILVSASAKGAT